MFLHYISDGMGADMKGDFSRNVDTSKKVKVEKKASLEWTENNCI